VDGRNVTELPQRGQASGLGILAALHPFFHADGQVAADFLVEVAFVGSHKGLGHSRTVYGSFQDKYGSSSSRDILPKSTIKQ
jgi:hypothetical protein